MSQNIIDVGSAPNDGTGDPLRNAFIAINENFDQIWNSGPVNSNVKIANNTITTTNINGNLVLAPSGIGVTQVKSSVVPGVDNVYDLGSPSQRFNSIYLGSGGLELAGNLNVDYYYGNGRFLTGVLAAGAPNIVFGATQVNIPGPNANVVFTINGTQSLEVANSEVNFFRPIESNSTISANGNITSAANLNSSGVSANSISATTLSIVGNTSSGNISVVGKITTPSISSTGNITLQPNGNIVFSNAVVNWLADPVQSQDAATKNYVDSVAQGLDVKASVSLATSTVLPSYTYNNGNLGIGATLTGTANAVLFIDGVAVTANSRVLIKNEIGSNQPYNGIYVVTVAGSASAAYVLTRSSDFDLPAEVPSAFTFVEGGNTNTDTGFVCITKSPVVFGSTNIVWQQFSGAGTYTAGPGLSLNGTQFFISNTGVAANTYGSSSAIPVLTVDIRGQITSATTANINAPASLITGNTLSSNVLISSLTAVGTLSSLSVSGNVNSANINASQIVSAVGNVTGGNLNTAGIVSAAGNIQGGNLSVTGKLVSTGNVESGANINGTNLNATANVNATGNINSGNVSASSNVNALNVNASQIVSAVGNVVGGNLVSLAKITATGNIESAANINGANINASGNISATGNINIGNISSNGNITALNLNATSIVSAVGNINTTANVNGGNIEVTGQISSTGNISSSGNIQGNNVFGTNLISSSGNVTGANITTNGIITAVGNITSTANIAAGNVVSQGIVTAIGNIIGSANVNAANVNATNIVSAVGNVIGGNISTAGIVTASGNITSTANVVGGNLITNGLITASGNVTGGNVTTSGIANVGSLSVTGTSSFIGNVTGNLSITANVSSGNITTPGLISAAGNVIGGNLTTTGIGNIGTLAVTGNTSLSGNIVSNVNVSSNIAGGNISTPGLISAIGNITSSANIAGNFVSPGANRQMLFNDNGLISSSSLITFDKAGPTLSLTNTAGTIITAYVSSLGGSDLNITPATNNLVIWGSANPRFSNTYTLGTSTFQWRNIWGGNANIGALSVSGISNLTGNLSVTANVSAGNISVTGNVNGGNLITTGLVSATGNVVGGNIVTAGQVDATGNVAGGNLTTAGRVDATGNVAGGNITTAGRVDAVSNVAGGNITTIGIVSATGNVQGGNVTTAGVVSASGNITSGANIAGGNLSITGIASVTGNITGGNVISSGLVTAIGNVSGANLNTSGNIDATGNIQGGNLITAGLISATGNIASAANVDGNNVNSVNLISASGNIIGGNLNTSGLVSSTGNVIGGNLVTAGLATVTGNVIGGNITTAGLITATGNVVGGNITTAGLVSASGNVQGGNLTTAGDISATGNIVGGNLITAGNVVTNTVSGVNLTLYASSNIFLDAGGNRIDMGGHEVTNLGYPNSSSDAATKQYVDDAVSTGIHIHTPVDYETPSALPSSTYVQGGNVFTVSDTIAGNTVVFTTAANLQVNDQLWFANSFEGIVSNTSYFVVSTPNASAAVLSREFSGEPVANITSNTGLTQSVRINSGIGATLTATANGALSVDGVAVSNSNRILVYNQANAVHNGVYTVSDTGNATAPWILTRALDSDQYVPDTNDGMDAGSYYYVLGGNTGAGESYVLTQPIGAFLIGYANIEFTQFSSSQVYSANTNAGLTLVGTTFSAKVDNDTTAFDVGGNIKVKDTANLVTPNIGTATGTSLSATGNVTGGNINSLNLISAVGNVQSGNLVTVGVVSANGNVSGGNIITAGFVSATSNITGGNLYTAGEISATGNAAVANISVTGNVNSSNVNTGFLNVNTLAGANISGNVDVIQITGLGGFLNATGANLSGNLNAGNASLGNLSLTGNITSNVNIDGNVYIENAVNIEAGLTVDSILVDTVGGIVANAGNIDINQITGLGGFLNATGANLSGNLTAGNTSISNLSLSGNITSNVNINGNVYIENDVNVEANLTVDSLLVDTVGGITANAGNIVINQITGQGGFLNAVGANLSGNLTAGNTAISNLSLSGNITSNVNIDGNVYIENAVNIEAPLTADSILVDTVGGITANAGNIDIIQFTGLGGWLNATGANISGNLVVNNISLTTQLSTAGNITAGYFIGDGSQLTNLTIAAGSQIINGNSNVSVAANGNVTVGTYGTIPATFANTGLYVTGLITATGNVSAAAVDTVGNIVAGGNVNVTNNAVVTGNISGGNISTLGNLSATGNVSGNYFLGNGALLTGIITSVANINNGTSNLRIDTANGDIQANVAGSANVFVITSSGIQTTGNISGNNLSISNIANVGSDLNVVGNIDVQGLITADGNVTALNLNTAGIVSATGNVIGGNVNAGGIVSATGNIITAANISGGNILSTLLISAGGNVTGANVTSNGVVTALGNVTGGNINSDGLVSATGNIVTTANVQGGNLISTGIISATGNVSGNYFLGNGACLTGVITSVANINNGTSNLRIDTSGGNILANVGGTANVFIITSNGVETTGTVSASGNIISTANVTGGNITTAGLITASGNITGGNLTTAGNVSGGNVVTGGIVTATGNIVSTANVTGGNITTAGLITASGNITGGNITTAGLITATGNIVSTANVTGGNLITSGIVTATGNIASSANIQAANLIATANISASGNITGNYYFGNGSQLTGIEPGGFKTLSVVGNAAGYVSGNVTLQASTTSGNLIPQAGNGIAMVGNATTNTLVISVLGSLNDGTIWAGGGDCELVSDAVVLPSYDNGLVSNAPTDEYDLGALPNPSGVTTTVSTTPPSSPVIGDMWIDSNTGTLYLYFDDGNSSQWAQMASVYSISQPTDYSSIAANVIPSANATYTLGNASNQWANAFVSGNVNVGNLSAVGNIVLGNLNLSGNIVDSGPLTLSTSANGNLTLTPNGTGITIVSSALSAAGNVTGANLNLSGNIVDTGPLTVITGSNGNITFAPNGTGLVISSSAFSGTGNVTGNIVNDSKGDLRTVPINSQTTSYTLVLSDVGKFISSNANVTVPASVFAAGDSISIYNNSAASITIVQAANVTMYNVGTSSTGNRTLAQRGLATVLCVAANTFVATGGGMT